MSGAPAPLSPMVCKSGEIVISDAAPLLATLGSCVGIIVYDRVTQIYALNHYLLPDPSAASRNSELEELEYGSVSIPTLFRKMKELGSQKKDLLTWVVGGASQFQAASEVGRFNIEIAERILSELDLPVIAQHVGGPLGRRVEVNIALKKISVWLLDGSRTRNAPDEIWSIP